MIDRSYNPDLLNSFLDYLDSALDKSQNTIKEYNYDLVTFILNKNFIKIHIKTRISTKSAIFMW